MRKHFPGCGRDLHKRGMTVDIKQIYHVDPSEKIDARNKAFDAAIKTLKRRMVQEGIIRDMRRKEYYESKGQIARKRKKEGERRVRKAAAASEEW
jgi:small subunit ribosomal protein S21